MLDLKAVRRAELPPGTGREQTRMARITELFHLMQPILRDRMIVIHAAVDEQKPAAGPQHPRGFPDKSIRRTEMMCRDPAGHEIEARVGVGKFLRRMLLRGDLEAPLGRPFPRPLEHRRREIADRYVVAQTGQVKSRVSRASRHIEHSRPRRQDDLFQRRLDIGYIGQDMPGSVFPALPRELLLRRPLRRIETASAHGWRTTRSRTKCLAGVVRNSCASTRLKGSSPAMGASKTKADPSGSPPAML